MSGALTNDEMSMVAKARPQQRMQNEEPGRNGPMKNKGGSSPSGGPEKGYARSPTKGPNRVRGRGNKMHYAYGTGKNYASLTEDTNSECRDVYSAISCQAWHVRGDCSKPTVAMWCRQTCGNCTDNKCTDSYPAKNCRTWKKDGSCKRNSIVLEGCAGTCGLCDDVTDENCQDKFLSDVCTVWKFNGKCDNERVKLFCPMTCGVCKALTKGKCRDDGEPRLCQFYLKKGYCDDTSGFKNEVKNNVFKMCKKTCGLCGSECADTSLPSLCKFYLDAGYCFKSKYKKMMMSSCKKSCDMCGTVCSDKMTKATCISWQRLGSCENNTRVKEELCPKTCGFC